MQTSQIGGDQEARGCHAKIVELDIFHENFSIVYRCFSWSVFSVYKKKKLADVLGHLKHCNREL